MTNTDQNLAERHATGIYAIIMQQVEDGAPFGYVDADGSTYAERDDDGAQPASAFDYLTDALDIHYVVDSDRRFRGARVAISLGGPNVWIDTEEETLTVNWGGSATRYLPSAFINPLREALSELWEMTA